MNILICDDDKEIVRAIEIYLKNEGYGTLPAYDGLQALQILEREPVHLVIMDIMMPGLDGLSATEKIRATRNVPIILLSAKSEDYDKIQGLNLGADDYITKPFSPMELVARVKSQLRRFTDLGSMEKPREGHQFRTGGLFLDDDEKTVTVDGEAIFLTPKEYGILAFLMKNMGKVFSIEQIYEQVWDEPAYNPDNTVAVHIRHIREKIEIDPKDPRYLKVVWGVGYKIKKIQER